MVSIKFGDIRAMCKLALAGFVAFSLSPASSAESVNGVDFDCLLDPKTRVMVGAPTQGIVDKVKVKRGDHVEAGEVLATLDARLEKAELKHAHMRSQMTSDIAARQADYRLAKATMNRLNDLHKKKLAPTQQRDEAVAALEVARMALAQAEDNQKLSEQEYARAREVVAQHVIRSPISGVVVDQVAFPGEFIYENPLMIIAQVDPLKVEAILPARYFGGVDVGMQASVWPEIENGAPLDVTISSVDRIIDSASGTFTVHLEVENPDNKIPAGQRCRLAFGEVDPEVMADRYASRN